MGVVQGHVLGRDQQFYAEPEATPFTFVKATAGGAFQATKFNASYAQERMDRNDNRATASLVSRISGKRTVTWDVEGYLIPGGALGVAPDMQELFQSVFGTETVNASTSVVYSLSSSQALQTLSLTRYATHYMQSLIGAWVNEMKISGSGSDAPKVSFSGGASRMVHTGRTALNGIMSSSTTMVVTTIDGTLIEADSVVQVSTNDNSSTGFRVTVDSARPSFTLEAATSGASLAAVVPFAPTPSYAAAGNVISGIAGSFTFGAYGTLPITAYEITVNNGLKPIEDQCFAVHVPDVIRGRRSCSGTFTMRLRQDALQALGIRKNSDFVAQDCALVLGSTSGLIATIDMDRCELEFSAIDFPEDEEATVQIPFTCLASSVTTSNEMSLTFT